MSGDLIFHLSWLKQLTQRVDMAALE